METPHIDHLSASDFEQVYEPAEDSFLLLDALEADLLFLRQLQPGVCVEVGSGSGVIITALAKIWPGTCLCLATDVNEFACKATQRTAQRNEVHVDVIRGNLLDALQPHSIDVLIFNPPYVVTTDEELNQTLADKMYTVTPHNLIPSWAGGLHGRRVINELLEKLDEKLSPKGVFYLLTLRENKPDEIAEQLTTMGFIATKLIERRIPGEYLYILKIVRA